jgi:hypothetical protein
MVSHRLMRAIGRAGHWIGFLSVGWICIANLLIALDTHPANAQSPAWLEEVTQWRETLAPDQQGVLFSPLDSQRTPVEFADWSAWSKVRPDWITQWREWLGPMPATGMPPAIDWRDSDTFEGVLRRRARIEVEPGVFMDAVVLTPDRPNIAAGSLPGVVALHSTTNKNIDELSGFHGDGPRAIGLHLAQRGYAVICPKCFLWQDVPDFTSAVDLHRQRHPGTLGMAKMLFDAQRAVDALVSLPEVDPSRLSAVGHSLGAKEVLYLMAFDSRVSVGVASEGGIPFEATNWEAPWYLGPELRSRPERPWSHAQLLALVAPRTLLILGGETGEGAADGKRSLGILSAAEPIWGLNRQEGCLAFWNHGQGHVFDQEQLDRTLEWLEAWVNLNPP